MSFIIKSVAFDITNACNMSCRHCYKSRMNTISNLSVSEILGALKEIERKGKISNIVLSGGETLLHPNIIELLNCLNGKYNIRINTNGILLNKFIEELKRIVKLKIQVSLDGYDEKTYYDIRNSNEFVDVISNSISAKNAGLNIDFRTSIYSGNIQNYEKFIELSRKLDIDLKLKPVIELDNVELKGLSISELKKWYIDVEKKKLTSYVEGNIFNRGYTCLILNEPPVIGSLYINEQGEIFPCLVLQSNIFKIGNVYNLNIDTLEKEIHTVRKRIRGLLAIPQCQSCDVRNAFGDGSCVAACFYGEKRCLNNYLKRGDIV